MLLLSSPLCGITLKFGNGRDAGYPFPMKPAFDNVATWLFFATLVVWALFELPQGLKRRTDATRHEYGSLIIVPACAIAGAVVAAFAVRAKTAAYALTPSVLALALVLMWSGIALRWWCFRTLGRYFTFTVMTSPEQRVISSGPYQVLRHPSYAGTMLVLTGIALMSGNWLSVAAFVLATLAGFAYRIRVEETALVKALGSAYTTYASGRKRLVPFLW